MCEQISFLIGINGIHSLKMSYLNKRKRVGEFKSTFDHLFILSLVPLKPDSTNWAGIKHAVYIRREPKLKRLLRIRPHLDIWLPYLLVPLELISRINLPNSLLLHNNRSGGHHFQPLMRFVAGQWVMFLGLGKKRDKELSFPFLWGQTYW